MKAISWIFRRLTQNEFRAITDQIQSEGGGSQTYIDLPKGKISDDDIISFLGEGTPMDKGYKWEVPVYSLSLDMPPQEITISQRRDSSNCIREQNKEKRINIWKSEYSNFPNDSYSESANPIYIFILKSDDLNFYAGWFYANDYTDNWFLTKKLCRPLFDESCGYDIFDTPISIDFYNYHWPFRSLSIPSIHQKGYHKLQQIFYGAPGTGKSFSIDAVTNEDNSVRTTFHPDSDYASFVGAYKPTMAPMPINAFVGTTVHHAKNADNEKAYENKIVYKYVPQAFIKAYVEAWKRYSPEVDVPYYLVIEEINRGHCAQIFGDLFQLLDRNNKGCSAYAINSSEDIEQFLCNDDKGFAKLDEDQRKAISEFILLKDNGKEEHIGTSILNGSRLLLPPNLRIWATMNTSDQSLFPIDSAFKRRWNWKYMPIEYNPIDKATGNTIDWKFQIGDTFYSWGEFLDKINPEIYNLTESSDKQMGYFFAKADPSTGFISEEVFLNKVLFYLWTDVFKDYDVSSEIFMNKNMNRSFRFTDFFDKNQPNALSEFIDNLKLNSVEYNKYSETEDESEDVETNLNRMNQRDYSQYSINGDGKYNKNQAVLNSLIKYVEANPSMTSSQIIKKWESINPDIPYFILSSAEFQKRIADYPAQRNRYNTIKTGTGETIYITNQWGIDRIPKFIQLINSSDLGIHIEKITE